MHPLMALTHSGLYFHAWNLLRAFERIQSPPQVVLFYSATHATSGITQVRQNFPDLKMKHFPMRAPYNLRMHWVRSRFNAINRVQVFQYLTNVDIPLSKHRANVFLVPDLTPLHFPHMHINALDKYWKR